ncbi:hypothetical protein NA57DRAFT_68942 [Rhizodiscina lignyota]|uniref:Exocyst complex component Sec8 n=1 Tax=Rhizodiscina lignyota TaxID=1504668 RepID=A0A9P4M448_9PEZI|nr:hypothetical protein NA57DRAFT_68942 [Rhizodiscina lignyota]
MSRRQDPFRSRPNGGGYGNGYANGYTASASTTSVEDYDPYNTNSYSSTPQNNPYGSSGSDPSLAPRSRRSPEPPQPPAARRDRRAGRAGGYGGFSFEAEEDEMEQQGEHVRRPSSIERMGAKRRSGGSPRAFVGRERRGGMHGRGMGSVDMNGAGGRQMQDILQYIQRDWDFMSSEQCVPVQIALQLMDSSSLGLAHRLGEFQDTHQQLQSALKAIVNEHHQGFNSSIGTFHNIQAAITASQTRLRTLKDSLISAKSNLSTAKPELKGLATQTQNYDDMLQVLASIEHLQSIPEQLEARITEKRFLGAVELLQDALRLIRKSEMDNIGALSDLRVYLSNQEHSLTDILIEELHSHLYLKSPYCESRWKQYAPSSTTGTDSPEQSGSAALARGRKLYHFLDKLDMTEPMVDDATRNPEADTFSYIQLLIEALNNLNRLEEAVEMIEQRLPVELFRVVERSNLEVDQRHPNSLRATTGKGRLDVPGPDNPRTVVLMDLLNTVFARFESIAESHRVVHEVIAGIVKREGLKDASNLTRGFRELWKLYQSEIRSVLHDYLATDAQAFRSGQDGYNRNIFRKIQRDKSKAMFKLTDMDSKSSDLTMEKEDLEKILKASVPGLVSDSRQTDLPTESGTVNAIRDGGTGHKLLIEPSVFNMGTLLPPSLVFLNRLKEVVPPSSDIATSTLTMFLDEFLVNVFLPQLDETLVELCAQTFTESDAFQLEPLWTSMAQKPIFKGSKKFFDLITAFCSMLDNLPHDQAFSQLIVTQMMTYYDTCMRWFDGLVARSEPKASGRMIKSSAFLARLPEMKTLMAELRDASDESRSEMIDKEIPIFLEKVGSEKLDEADLIVEGKSISALCLIYTSMKWLASKVSHLRHITTQTTDSSRRHSGRPQLQRSWTDVASSDPQDQQISVYLPLSKETAAGFDQAVGQYRALADQSIETLHFEMRCHAVYHLQKSLRETYMLEQIVKTPQEEISDMNADLVAFDEELGKVLPAKQQAFITTGLGALMDQVLVSMGSSIKLMNTCGCSQVQMNILVLQQNLKNIEPAASFKRAATYYDLAFRGADAVIAKAKEEGRECGFSYEEMKTLLELCYSGPMKSEDSTVQVQRQLDEHLLELSEYLY